MTFHLPPELNGWGRAIRQILEDSSQRISKLIATQDSPYQVAEVYAYRGQTNQAFVWLERSYRERDPGLNQLKLDPLLKSLRSEPRYTELLTRMGLPTYPLLLRIRGRDQRNLIT